MLANPSPPALAERVRGLAGWRGRLGALVAGAASVLALAPFFAWPILWITLPILVWLIDGALARRAPPGDGRWWRRPEAAAAEVGWWFGFGYFLAGLFWIGEAFLVEAEIFAVLMPARRHPDADGSGALLRGSGCSGGTVLEGWRVARAGAGPVAVGHGMAARPCAHRFSRGTCWVTLSPIRCR